MLSEVEVNPAFMRMTLKYVLIYVRFLPEPSYLTSEFNYICVAQNFSCLSNWTCVSSNGFAKSYENKTLFYGYLLNLKEIH